MAVLMLAVFLLTACTPLSEPPTPKPEPTMRITFPSSYTSSFSRIKDKNIAQTVADEFKSLGDEYYTDAIANPDGSVTAILTQRQRDNLIAVNNTMIDGYTSSFTKLSPDYHYTINDDYTRLDIWTDRNITFNVIFNMFTGAPQFWEYNYYLERRGKHWDMDIIAHNCHTGQITYQHKASELVTPSNDQLGE